MDGVKALRYEDVGYKVPVTQYAQNDKFLLVNELLFWIIISRVLGGCTRRKILVQAVVVDYGPI